MRKFVLPVVIAAMLGVCFMASSAEATGVRRGGRAVNSYRVASYRGGAVRHVGHRPHHRHHVRRGGRGYGRSHARYHGNVGRNNGFYRHHRR